MSENQVEDFEFDLDSDIDELPDLPEFITPLSGAYVVTVPEGFTEKSVTMTINGTKSPQDCYDIKFVIDAIAELTEEPDADAGEVVPKAGDSFNILIRKKSQAGIGVMKKILVAVSEATGVRKTRELIDLTKGKQFLIIVKRRWHKKSDRYVFGITQIKCT